MKGNDTGQLIVRFVVRRKVFPRHVRLLVAEAFLPNPSGLKEVRHKDDDRRNNNSKNLEHYTPILSHTEISGLASPERWVPIKNYEDVYDVSNMGRIRNRKTMNIKATRNDVNGYEEVHLWKEKHKKVKVHLIVAEAFLPNPGSLPVVHHKNHIKSENCVDNLQRVTFSENTRLSWEYHHGRVSNTVPVKDSTVNSDEIWKKIGMYRGFDFSTYDISNYGNVRGRDKNNLALSTCGYLSVCLRDPIEERCMNCRCHRLVARYFVHGRTDERNVVHHIDEHKHNNHFKNLQWVTSQENAEYSCGIAIEQLDKDSGKVIKQFPSITAAFTAMGRTRKDMIASVLRGKFKTAYGFKWRKVTIDTKVQNIEDEDEI